MIIWVKTPRCAGTSLLRQCKTLGIIPEQMICIVPRRKNDFIAKNKAVWDQAYKIAIVRNPFDRMISAWKYLQQTKHIRPGISLKELLINLPDQTKYPKAWLHLTQSQADLIQDVDGCITYDKIVRFESINIGLYEVCMENGIEPFELYRSNESVREPGYRQYYDSETRAMVEQKYWIDLKLFGYEF